MKRKLFLAASAALFLAIGTITTPAVAQQPETWVAHQSFVSGLQQCKNYRTVDYTYTFDGKVLTVRNQNGNLGKIEATADGQVDKVLDSPTGAKLRISGNAQTKQLRVTNGEQCIWDTMPIAKQATR